MKYTSEYNQATNNAKNYSKSLRKNLTKQEAVLWNAIKNKKLGVKFRKQVPIDNFIADFCCFELNLIIELDGGQHSQQIEYDKQKTLFFNSKGFKVLRYWNNEINDNLAAVVEDILLNINKLKNR